MNCSLTASANEWRQANVTYEVQYDADTASVRLTDVTQLSTARHSMALQGVA